MAALTFLAVQLAAALGAWWFFVPPSWPWALAQGALAGGVALALRRSVAAMLPYALFVPLALGLSALGLPAWVYALLALLCYAVGRNAWRERVPLYLSSHGACERLAGWLPPGASLLDLGSGDGKLAVTLGRLRPDVRVLGLESAWLPHLLGRWRWWRAGRPANVELRYGDFWTDSWSGFDAVYAFLSPAPMPRLWTAFAVKADPGACLISNSFDIPGVPVDQTLVFDGTLQTQLLIWRHPHGSR